MIAYLPLSNGRATPGVTLGIVHEAKAGGDASLWQYVPPIDGDENPSGDEAGGKAGNELQRERVPPTREQGPASTSCKTRGLPSLAKCSRDVLLLRPPDRSGARAYPAKSGRGAHHTCRIWAHSPDGHLRSAHAGFLSATQRADAADTMQPDAVAGAVSARKCLKERAPGRIGL